MRQTGASSMAVALRAVVAPTAPATDGRSSRLLGYERAAICRLRAVDPSHYVRVACVNCLPKSSGLVCKHVFRESESLKYSNLCVGKAGGGGGGEGFVVCFLFFFVVGDSSCGSAQPVLSRAGAYLTSCSAASAALNTALLFETTTDGRDLARLFPKRVLLASYIHKNSLSRARTTIP